MKARLNYGQVSAGGYAAMGGLEKYLHGCGLEEALIHLVKLRASQLNGCAYCLDMHWKDLVAVGEQHTVLAGPQGELASTPSTPGASARTTRSASGRPSSGPRR